MTGEPDYFSKYKTVDFERTDDGVLVIRLHSDGGPVLYGSAHHAEWPQVFTDVGADRDNRVVVITGTGDAFINQHGEWGAPVETPSDWDVPSWAQKTLINRLLEIEAPVIGAINGPATIHAELAVLSDIVLANDNTVLADEGHFAVGETPADGVQIVWQELLGTNRGRYFLLTGQNIDAYEAQRLGVVNEVLPREVLMRRALELAHQMATYSDLTLRYTRVTLIDRWRKLFADGNAIGYGMALEALSHLDRGWVVWDKSNEGKENYHALRRLHARPTNHDQQMPS